MEGDVTETGGPLIDWKSGASSLIDLSLLPTNNRLRVRQGDGTTVYSLFSASTSLGVNVPFKIASCHTESKFNGAINGTALTANTGPTAMPDLSSANFVIGSTTLNGRIRKLSIIPRKQSDEQLEELTS